MISIPASWITYRFIESPIRKLINTRPSKNANLFAGSLAFTIPLFASAGLFIAKSNGFPERFEHLNPFALEVSKANSSTFHSHFSRGFQVSEQAEGRALFIGDSVLQHYVIPVTAALNLEVSDVDTVSRGGCVLLKGVEFKDQFSDISCNELRSKLYQSDKRYEYVVISQAWNSYDSSILNFQNREPFSKWRPFISQTLEHFSHLVGKIILIGWHPEIAGTNSIQPTITLNKEKYIHNLNSIKVKNISELQHSSAFFHSIALEKGISLVEPYKIFCEKEPCQTADKSWSFFADSQHLTGKATSFVANRINELLKGQHKNIVYSPN